MAKDDMDMTNDDFDFDSESEGLDYVPREIKKNLVRVLEHGKDVEISIQEFQKKYGAFGLIRIPKNEFDYIENLDVKQLTHFNLQVSSHKPKEKYLLVKILEHGHLNNKTNDEQLPLLDVSNPQLFECVECLENLDYKDLPKDVFENSFPNIKSVEQLKTEIINRYSKSMSYLTNDEILELGVSVTKLKRDEPKEDKNKY